VKPFPLKNIMVKTNERKWFTLKVTRRKLVTDKKLETLLKKNFNLFNVEQ